MENILFIGNGFDLHNKMQTSCTDYLKSLMIPDSYLDDMETLIEIERCFKLLSSVEIYFENPNVNYLGVLDLTIQTTGKIIISMNLPINLNHKFASYSDCIYRIKNEYDDLRKYNFDNNIKIYFNDFSNVVKFDILRLVAICITDSALSRTNFDFFKPLITFKGDIFRDLFTMYNDFNYIDLDQIQNTNYSEILSNITEYKKNYNCFSLYLELIRSRRISIANNLSELMATENWIDLENILYHNQFVFFQSIVSNDKLEDSIENLFMYRNFVKLFDYNLEIDADFELFKYDFAQYINKQQKNINTSNVSNLLTNINNRFKLTKIYNFNYSNYINDIFKNIDNRVLIDNVHGSVEDGKNIVFGSNHYLFLNDLIHYNDMLRTHKQENHIYQKELHYKLTKFYQVLRLSETRNASELDNVNSLTVLGHSIGNQDFEYLHTIIATNPQKIKLNIIWSTFQNSSGEIVNNLEALTEAVYEMLESYKELYKDITVHKMILENRIKFIHLDDFIKSAE